VCEHHFRQGVGLQHEALHAARPAGVEDYPEFIRKVTLFVACQFLQGADLLSASCMASFLYPFSPMIRHQNGFFDE
jgi:hypothetical protein